MFEKNWKLRLDAATKLSAIEAAGLTLAFANVIFLVYIAVVSPASAWDALGGGGSDMPLGWLGEAHCIAQDYSILYVDQIDRLSLGSAECELSDKHPHLLKALTAINGGRSELHRWMGLIISMATFFGVFRAYRV